MLIETFEKWRQEIGAEAAEADGELAVRTAALVTREGAMKEAREAWEPFQEAVDRLGSAPSLALDHRLAPLGGRCYQAGEALRIARDAVANQTRTCNDLRKAEAELTLLIHLTRVAAAEAEAQARNENDAEEVEAVFS